MHVSSKANLYKLQAINSSQYCEVAGTQSGITLLHLRDVSAASRALNSQSQRTSLGVLKKIQSNFKNIQGDVQVLKCSNELVSVHSIGLFSGMT